MAMKGYDQSQVEVSQDNLNELIDSQDSSDIEEINKYVDEVNVWLRLRNTKDEENDKFIKDKGTRKVKEAWNNLILKIDNLLNNSEDKLKIKDIISFQIDPIGYHVKAKEENKNLDEKSYSRLYNIYKLVRTYGNVKEYESVSLNRLKTEYGDFNRSMDFQEEKLERTGYSDDMIKSQIKNDREGINSMLISLIQSKIIIDNNHENKFSELNEIELKDNVYHSGSLEETSNSINLLKNDLSLYETHLEKYKLLKGYVSEDLENEIFTDKENGLVDENGESLLSYDLYNNFLSSIDAKIKPIQDKISDLKSKNIALLELENKYEIERRQQLIMEENKEIPDLLSKSEKTRKYYDDKEDMIYSRSNILNPNGKNRLDNKEVYSGEGLISLPTNTDLAMVNAYCEFLDDGDSMLFEGGASSTQFSDSNHKIENFCNEKITNIFDKLSPENKPIFSKAIEGFKNIEQGDGNSFLAWGRALVWVDGLSQQNINKHVGKISFEIKLGGDPNVKESRSGNLKFKDAKGNIEYADLEHSFPDGMFQNNVSSLQNTEYWENKLKNTRDPDKKQKIRSKIEEINDMRESYGKNLRYISGILSYDPNTVVLLEGFTGTSGGNFGGTELNNRFADNIFAQEELLLYTKPGYREEFKSNENNITYDYSNISKYMDLNKIKEKIVSDGIAIPAINNGEVNLTSDEVLIEVVRRVALSINRSEKIKDDIINMTYNNMNKPSFQGVKQTKEEIEGRIFMVGHGTRNREVSTTKKDYRRGSFTLLQK